MVTALNRLTIQRFPKKLLISLCTLLIFQLCFIGYVLSEPIIICRGSGFNLYFESGSVLAFHHARWALIVEHPFTVNVTVASGTLNGTNGVLEMLIASGQMSFNALNSCTLSAPDVLIIVNGGRSSTGQIQNGDAVLLKWGAPVVVWDPYLSILGLIGLCMFPITITYSVYEIKKKKNYMWFVYCFALLALAYGLVWGWLAGS